MNGPASLRLADGRLHLQHGPIDCIIEAWGEPGEVAAAYAQVTGRFDDILPELVRELYVLRQPVGAAYPLVRGPVARRMIAAAWPHRQVFITPMAAVAGAVADELLAALVLGRNLAKAYVNDGGDIALHLNWFTEFDVGMASDSLIPALVGGLKVSGCDPARGVATSGWRGRSQSLGIADSITVLADSAADADAAATLIANAVTVDHPAIRRLPASSVKEESDLGELPVTVEVGALPQEAIAFALDSGQEFASSLYRRGLIRAAYLCLQGNWRALPSVAAPRSEALQC